MPGGRRMSRTGRAVLAKCRNCGKEQIRQKGKSGISCVNSGKYCGVMWVIKEVEQ
tara:strand:- start:921 stop:1085 length:165 start_codon:yes stop_codon:yes gene_type:complete